MATTFQIGKRTRQLLEVIKRSMSAKSYDEVLQKLFSEKWGYLPPRSVRTRSSPFLVRKTRLNSMGHDYVIDSYAWIEYFRGSKMGEKARRYIKEEYSATPTVVHC